ncbi:MAG: hypothetical protein IPM59_07520 [Chloracidobacterium sp.]|nr:hypothetical protein [Chloracidobacterium sp.]
MLMYALIGLSLVLVGVAGLQFAYLFYIDRIYRERQRYLQGLEYRYNELKAQLDDAQRRLAVHEPVHEWAEVIEEH